MAEVSLTGHTDAKDLVKECPGVPPQEKRLSRQKVGQYDGLP